MFFISSSRVSLRPYDVTICFYVLSFMQIRLNFAREVFFRFYWSEFFLFIRVKEFFWSYVTLLTLKNDFLSLKLTLIQSDKIKWVCVTLIEVNLWAVNRSSIRINIFVNKKYNIHKKEFIGLFHILSLWGCPSTKLLRLISGNLPAMFPLLICLDVIN